jgi:flavodoxin
VKIRKVRLVYFSPTGTTRSVLESIASGIGLRRQTSGDRAAAFSWDKILIHRQDAKGAKISSKKYLQIFSRT